MALGFDEEIGHDPIYEAQYGFHWAIISLRLTKRIYLQWDKETRLCWIYRMDKGERIQAKRPIFNLNHLRDVVAFFLEKDDGKLDPPAWVNYA
jgi:hypothetical protein